MCKYFETAYFTKYVFMRFNKYSFLFALYTFLEHDGYVENNNYPGVFMFVKRRLRLKKIASDYCCILSVMFEVRYAGVDRADGNRGMLVQACSDHLRIDIHASKPKTPWG
jgi:hypothetical protein